MLSEFSIYIIKPEAISFNKEIHNLIIAAGLTITKQKQGILPTRIVDKIYLDCPQEILDATEHFMFKKICEVGIVSGDKAIQKLIEICGTETNPINCKDGTIRKMFGVSELQYYNGTGYFMNAIHRPKTKEEFVKDMKLLNDFINS
jgi:nucleoside diphosphate kinase